MCMCVIYTYIYIYIYIYIYVSIWLEEREYRQEVRLVYFMDNGC